MLIYLNDYIFIKSNVAFNTILEIEMSDNTVNDSNITHCDECRLFKSRRKGMSYQFTHLPVTYPLLH